MVFFNDFKPFVIWFIYKICIGYRNICVMNRYIRDRR